MNRVHVSTPSRLHFGLLRLHETTGRSFGGLGLMIDHPRVELTLTPAQEWSVSGAATNREIGFARSALDKLFPHAGDIAALAIDVRSTIPQHRGLGGGTQLALAIAAGIRALLALPPATAEELAASVGRGQRSAIGTHGFLHGGLIWERGRSSNERLAPVAERIELPPEWRFVLITPQASLGLHGSNETEAFAQTPAVPEEITARLEAIAENDVLPAARQGDADAFGEAVYAYGRLAGECFAPVQGGPYASPEIAGCVATLRDFGVRGVGQSSWGPTIFALTPSPDAAAQLVRWWQGGANSIEADLTIAAPDKIGARISASTSA